MKAKLLFPIALASLALLTTEGLAVGTRRFVLNTAESFQGGDAAGVSVGSDGTVRAGLTLGKLPIPEASSVWDSVVTADGAVLLATGSGGNVFRVRGGQTTIAASTGALAVSALVLGFDGMAFAGTFPEGTIFRVDPKATVAAGATRLAPWVTLPETEDVWDLAYDAKNKALYAATGPEGRLYRIDASGKAEIHFDSEEPHLVSVAVAPDGSVYTGSSGKALLYRVTGPGRASVVHDFEGDDVRAIAIVPAGRPHAGDVYVTANDYRGAVKSFRPLKRAKMQATNEDQPEPKAGKGRLARIATSGALEMLLEDGDTHFVALTVDDSGLPVVGTGVEGKVISVDDQHVTRVLVDTEERQAAAIGLSGKTRFVVSSDPVVYHEITGSGGTEAVWTSRVLDAGLRAHHGRLDWIAEGALEFQTRSGNTDKPDATWSDWSKPLTERGPVTSPAARFVQVRARWSKDPNAVLREVRLPFVTDNARAVITSVEVGDTKAETGSATVPASGGAPDDASAKLRLRWKLDNPDNDEIRFRLSFRPVGSTRWKSLLDASEVLTKKEYTWDTSGLPEGRYRVRVEASDELANPPGTVLAHALESTTFVIDNTAPVLSNLALKNARLSGTATDGVGPIARIEVAVVGEKPFYPLLPKDGVFDEASEAFDVDLATLLPEGPQHVVVRVYDSAGNRTSGTVTR